MTIRRKAIDKAVQVHFFVAGLVGLFLLFRLWKFLNTENIILWWDSAAYALVSIWPISTEQFWFGRQPPFYPFFFKPFAYTVDSQEPVLGWFSAMFSFNPGIVYGLGDAASFHLVRESYDIISMSITQFLISVSCWAFFAVSVSRKFQRPLTQVLAAFVILGLGCESMITLWDRHIMTEALSISFFVLVIAFFLHYQKATSSLPAVVLMLLLITFFSLIRMTNNYFLVFMIAFVIIHVWKNKPRNLVASMIIVLLMTGLVAFNQVAIFKGERSKFPMKSLVSSRISTNGFEDAYQHFRDNGMPEIPPSFQGQLWEAPYEQYPELDSWMKQEAATVYQHFLATHPIYFLTRPFTQTNELNKTVYEVLSPDVAPYEVSEKKTYKLMFTDQFLWTGVIVCMGLLILQRRRTEVTMSDLLLPLVIIVGSCAALVVVWHGDLVELDRHSLQFALGLRLGLILAALALLDSEPLVQTESKSNQPA